MHRGKSTRHGDCEICAMDIAADVNHCTWCGENMENTEQMIDHLDAGCFEEMLVSLGFQFDRMRIRE